MSSIADSSATTSPARTTAPFCTLMAASWPPTSGATRISVVRTTPTSGAGGAECHRSYAPMPATARLKPSAIVRMCFLAMRRPPFDERGRYHGEREIDHGKGAEPTPVVHHLPQARAQLVDADDAVDRKIGREDRARGEDGPRDRFARPGKAGHEELRQTGG